jgi:hypothetical protein
MIMGQGSPNPLRYNEKTPDSGRRKMVLPQINLTGAAAQNGDVLLYQQ